jgi:hypothetical protein
MKDEASRRCPRGHRLIDAPRPSTEIPTDIMFCPTCNVYYRNTETDQGDEKRTH